MTARRMYWLALNGVAIWALSLVLLAPVIGLSGGFNMGFVDPLLRIRLEDQVTGALWVLIALAMAFGVYGRGNRWYWLCLTGFSVVCLVTIALGYVLPWGQINFWLASVGVPVVTGFVLVPLGLAVVLGLHVQQLARRSEAEPYWGRYSMIGMVLGALLILGLVWLQFQPFARLIEWQNNHDVITLGDGEAASPSPDGYTILPLSDAANPLSTPAHIVPEWYALPSYAVLRATPGKVLGVVALVGYNLVWLALPWLDRGAPGPIWRRRRLAWVFAGIGGSVLVLILTGAAPAEGLVYRLSQLATGAIFLLFLVVLPVLSRREG